MGTKESVLAMLLEAGGSMTGEAMAKRLGISRMAVFKGVEGLRADGYEIAARTRGGYTLLGADMVLDAAAIQKGLRQPHEVLILDQVDSTNTYLRTQASLYDGDRAADDESPCGAKRAEHAESSTRWTGGPSDGTPANQTGGRGPDGTPDGQPSGQPNGKSAGLIVAARKQTGGRGRRGKHFYSPPGSGVYFSFLLRQPLPMEHMWAVTFMAAIATARTLRAAGADARIKWVNDVYIPPRKICGILTEVSLDAEARTSSSIVVGIGVNLKETERPEELKDKIISLEQAGASLTPNEAITQIVNHFDEMLDRFDLTEIVREYKSLCFILGRGITFERDGVTHAGTALDILPDGNLLVATPQGNTVLSSGEVSILPDREPEK